MYLNTRPNNPERRAADETGEEAWDRIFDSIEDVAAMLGAAVRVALLGVIGAGLGGGMAAAAWQLAAGFDFAGALVAFIFGVFVAFFGFQFFAIAYTVSDYAELPHPRTVALIFAAGAAIGVVAVVLWTTWAAQGPAGI